MIRDEDGALTGYVYLDLKTRDYGGFVSRADKLLKEKLVLAGGYTYRWAGEYEFELRAKERLAIADNTRFHRCADCDRCRRNYECLRADRCCDLHVRDFRLFVPADCVAALTER